MFITFEGVDGSGKSTQVRAVSEALRAEGKDVVMTREPGGSQGAEEIRALIVMGSADRWSPETELLLFNAARRDHLEKTILPALERGAIVICDRFVDSTRAYQGEDQQGLDRVNALHEMMIGIEADLTILLDIDPDKTGSRDQSVKGYDTRFESKGSEFMRKRREAFLSVAASDPGRIRVVDADRGIPEITSDILSIIRSLEFDLGPE